VHLIDDSGRELDADYQVEADSGHLALVLESSEGGENARNPDYNQALLSLLRRLGALDATLSDGLVDSRTTRKLGLPEADRRFIHAPIRIALEPDLEALRKRLGTAQSKVAQSPGVTRTGNATRRIRLRVSDPGFVPGDAARLEHVLARPSAAPPKKQPGYWWDREPGENLFMEITGRSDIGTDLKAPSAARGGVSTASYALVPLVRPGDIVVHYDSRQEAIVGVSVASSSAEPAPMYWAARGSYARRAGERPRWLPGLRVELEHYLPLEPPVTLAEIRRQREAILELRQQIQARAGGQPIYFPWIPYQDTLRTFQSYLVKMPRQAVSLIPQLQAAVNRAQAEPPKLDLPSPAEQAEEAVKDAAGKFGRRRRGQGFQLDQAAKVAIEARAMNMAIDFYSKDWQVEDVHSRESYDLVCRRGTEVRHVEVKGTANDGTEVILTPNEVTHARANRHAVLFVVSNITIQRADDGSVTAGGGQYTCYDPWHLDDGTLTPVGFRYQVPAKTDST
jgi:hypothetical protein